MKLKAKLILILLPLSILSLLIFGAFVYNHLITTFRQEVLEKMHNTLEQTKQNIRAHLHSAHDQLRVLAANEMLREYLLTDKSLRFPLAKNNISTLFSSYQRNNTDYKEINLLLADGTIDRRVMEGQQLSLSNTNEIPTYFETIRNNRNVLTEQFISSEEDTFFLLSYKLYLMKDFVAQKNNEVASLHGYLNFIIQPNFLFNNIKKKTIGKAGYLFLTDKNGKIIFYSLNQEIPSLASIQKSLSVLEKPILNNSEHSFYLEGLKLSENLFLLGYLPDSEVLEAGVFLKDMLLITALISGLLIFVLLYISMNHFIVKPIYKLSAIAERLKSGNLSLEIVPPSKDEIGYLYSSFDDMVKHLREVLDKIEHTNETLEIKIKERTLDLEKVNADLIEARHAAEESNRIKSAFIANLSHEFRTPLNGILGMSEVISKLETDEALQQQAKIINDCGNTLLVLIEELLDVAQLDAGSIILDHLPFDIRQTLRDSVNLVHSKAQQKGIKLQLNTAPLLPQYLIGDAQRLRQVILNLLMNAIKFTEQGEIVVYTEIIEDNQEVITFQINIIDTGIGISQEKQLLLFKYFNQIDNVSSRNYTGTGVGLFICHKIISLMKGQIGVISKLHEGSTFWVKLSLPIAIPKKSFEHFTIQRRIVSRQPKNILVVEDDLTTQKFMQLMLEKIGCKVDVANNGQRAIEMVEKNAYDLIFMDIIMPIMDGYTAVKTLRGNIALQDLPVIAVSSLDPEKETEKIKWVGISDYLSKPVTPTSLNKMLNKWLNKSN
jgi:signal transduction histidine kinase/ActR/RegA family two-component response regulator